MSDNLRIVEILQVKGAAFLLIIMLASVLGGCASSSPYSGEDVELAAQQGNLEAMYVDVDQALQKARPGTERHTSLTLVRNDLVYRLSAPHQQRLDALFELGAAAALSLPELDELDTEIATIKRWKPFQAEEFEGQAADLRAVTEQEMAALSATLVDLQADEVGQHYVASMRLAHLEGGESGEQRRAQATDELARTYHAALEAVEKKQLPEAQLLLNEVAYAEPDYRDVVHNQGLVATGLFEQSFWQYLVDGRPEDAYEVFHDFAQTPAFAAHRNQVALDAGDLAEYFDAVGDKALRQGDWLGSYQAFTKSSFIRSSLRLPTEPSQGLSQFVREMERRYQAASRRDEQAAAFAYLSVIESVYPQHALPSDHKGTVQGEVMDRAAVKLSLERFQGEFGSEISAALGEELRGSAQRELRLASDQQLTAIARGQSAYRLSGITLNADVRRQQATRQESQNTVIGSEPGANPEYAAWKRLPKNEREQVPEPPKAANLPIHEYATFTYTDVTSLAEMSVDFQLVDPLSGEVRMQEIVKGTSMEEGTEIAPFTLGSFTQEAVVADIPTERGQLEALAGDVAGLIHAQLSARFSALDRHYVEQAERLVEENQRAAAAQSWAFAYVVSDPEGEQHAQLRTAMEEAVLR